MSAESPVIYDQHGCLYIEARVNDGAKVTFILDTGASRSTLSKRFAESMALEVTGKEQITGTAGTVEAEVARAQVQIEHYGSLDLDLLIYEFGSLRQDCVGILGYELLTRQSFQLDYQRRLISWNKELCAPLKATTMSLDGRIPRISAMINGQAMDMRIDSGASLAPSPDFTVNLAPEQAAALKLSEREPLKVYKATGTGGLELKLPVYSIDQLEIAGIDIAAPKFAIVQPAVGYFARPGAVGFFGNSVLDKLNPWFDYSQPKMAVVPPVAQS